MDLNLKSLVLLFALLSLSIAMKAQTAYASQEDTISFSARSAPDLSLFPFFHGVASGDPLEDAVIIWTRLTTDDTGVLPVNWRVGTDSALQTVVQSGTFMTDVDRDFTVKVDVTGLSPDQWYYYEFEYQGRRSLIGRTRTAPAAGAAVDSLRFALMSCSNYQAGYFNAYANLADRNDLDAIIHVGDYIYEYQTGGYGFAGLAGRDHDPDNEIINLSDYRLRHSWYKLDPDSRDLHQLYPWIIIYDDHEFANDAWRDGAQNHGFGEGSWADRKSNAFQAWLEWMPVRDPQPDTSTIVYRNLPFGNLIDFFVIDTRFERDVQNLFAAGNITHSILGETQFEWLSNGLTQSTATWKVLVNQVFFSPLDVFGLPFNPDAWDGYSAERERLFDSLVAYGVSNFVVLTGDIHTAWSNEIPSDFGNLGAEFVTTSVTSPGVDIPGGEFFIELFNPHVKYVNLAKHGFLIVDFNQTRVQGDHWFVNTLNTPDPGASAGPSYKMDVGTVGLINAGSPSTRPGPGPALPPDNPINSCAIPENLVTSAVTEFSATFSWDASPGAVGYLLQGQLLGSSILGSIQTSNISESVFILDPGSTYQWRVAASCDSVNISPFTEWQIFSTDSIVLRKASLESGSPQMLGVYPVPFQERIGVHFSIDKQVSVSTRLIDAQGQIIDQQNLGNLDEGAYFREWQVRDVSSGSYWLQLCAGSICTQRQVQKQ